MRSALAAILGGLVVLWTPPDTGSAIIRGRVVSADGGAPLARAEVTLGGDRSSLLFTDADGHYEFGSLPPGRYTVRAGRAGYVTVDRGQPIDLANKQRRDGVDFALRRGGAIDVTIVDESDDPVADVAILAAHGVPRRWPEDATPPLTDEDGHARLFDLAPGTYYLTAKVDDTRPSTFYPGTGVASEAKPVQVVATQTVSARMQMTMWSREAEDATARGRISGRVLATGAQGSAPLARATVLLTSPRYGLPTRRVQTDADGRYAFAHVVDGLYALRVQRRGFVAIDYGERAYQAMGRLLRVAGGKPFQNIDFTMQPGASLTVRVVDELGNPHAHVHVNLGRGKAADTDDRGEVRFRDVAPDQYVLSAGFFDDVARLMPPSDAPRDRALAYVRDAMPVALEAGQERTVQMTLTPTRAAHVGGRVISANGAPAGGEVLIREASTIAVTETISQVRLDAKGQFLFPTIWPGRYVVETTGDQREYAGITVDVFNDDVTDLIVKTTPGGTLRGRVVFESGQPPTSASPADFSLSAYFREGAIEHSAYAQPIDDWSFTLTGVIRPSLITAYGNRENGWIVSRILRDGTDVTHVPLQDADNLQVVLTRASVVEGTVIDPDNQCASRCGILLFSERTPGSKRFVYVNQSNDAGGFIVGPAVPGRYFIVALPTSIEDETTAPASLDRLERGATRVTVPAGGGVTIKVSLPLSEPEPQPPPKPE